jgi:hypothetical protein
MIDLPELKLPMIQTSGDSPDSLPTHGYSVDQLSKYIKRQLGEPVWAVELTNQHIIDHIRDALVKFSLYKPMLVWGAVPMIAGQKQYLIGQDVGQGVAELTFVENRLGVLNLDFGNPFTTMSIMTTGLGLDGMGEYDSYLRWQKTWQRVTSTLPQWQYDEVRKCLWIHNPISRYRAALLVYANWQRTEDLPAFGSIWVKEYALAKSQYQQGDLWLKYSGNIPSPAASLQLDTGKRDKAETKIKDLETELKAAQEITPLSID